MSQSRVRHRDRADDAPLPFPSQCGSEPDEREPTSQADHERTDATLRAEDAIEAVESMSRRIRDLARELNCLGYFDDDGDDRPRAA